MYTVDASLEFYQVSPHCHSVALGLQTNNKWSDFWKKEDKESKLLGSCFSESLLTLANPGLTSVSFHQKNS